MDFITGIPKVAGNFDSIFVVVDKLTKVAHLIPTRTTASASDIAQLFVKEVVRLHGIPARIISETEMLSSFLNSGELCSNPWIFF